MLQCPQVEVPLCMFGRVSYLYECHVRIWYVFNTAKHLMQYHFDLCTAFTFYISNKLIQYFEYHVVFD